MRHTTGRSYGGRTGVRTTTPRWRAKRWRKVVEDVELDQGSLWKATATILKLWLASKPVGPNGILRGSPATHVEDPVSVNPLNKTHTHTPLTKHMLAFK